MGGGELGVWILKPLVTNQFSKKMSALGKPEKVQLTNGFFKALGEYFLGEKIYSNLTGSARRSSTSHEEVGETNTITMYFDSGLPKDVDVDEFCKKICESNKKRYHCKNTFNNDGCKGNGWNHSIVDKFNGCDTHEVINNTRYPCGCNGVGIDCKVKQFVNK